MFSKCDVFLDPGAVCLQNALYFLSQERFFIPLIDVHTFCMIFMQSHTVTGFEWFWLVLVVLVCFDWFWLVFVVLVGFVCFGLVLVGFGWFWSVLVVFGWFW